MIAFNMSSPAEVMADLSERVRRRRIDGNVTQRDLAAKSGVSYSSLRLFEETGKISLEAVVKIAFVLGAEGEFGQLFPPQAPRTIEDVIDRPQRKRACKSRDRTCPQNGRDARSGSRVAQARNTGMERRRSAMLLRIRAGVSGRAAANLAVSTHG